MGNGIYHHFLKVVILPVTFLILGGQKSLAQSEQKWQLQLSNQSYISANQGFFRSRQVNDQFSRIGIDGRSDWQPGQWSNRIDISAFQSLAEEKFYFNPRELYVSHLTADSQLAFGRKKNSWSESEKLWRRGLWEPQFDWDKLWPEQQGLTGVFWQKRINQQWTFLAYASPAYIPSMGPQFDIHNGEIFSANPWFRPPVDEIEFFQKKTNILYEIQTPNTADVISHPGGAMKLAWSDGLGFVNLSWAYKPMNQLLFKAPFNLLIGNGTQPEIPLEVNVIPYVAYHRLATFETGLKSKQGHKFTLAITRERPEYEAIPHTWLDQQTGQALLTDIIYEHLLDADYGSRWYVAYSHLDGGDKPSLHELVKGKYMFERRYRYQNAIRVGVQDAWGRLWGRPVTANTEFTYDTAQRGAIFTAGLTVNWQSQLKVTLSADILGLIDDGEASADTGFIREYRANDRFKAGMAYVF